MFELVVETSFAAAHNLRGYDGMCEQLHGHNWKVDVTLRAEELDELGMVMDFKEVKRMLSDVMQRLDHKYLNDLPEFAEANPTTENISRMVFHELSAKLPEGIAVGKVTVWESERCGATYCP